jgi:23S rRNA (adenine-N6)-dimethyltransferase
VRAAASAAAPWWGWHRLTDDWAARIVAGAAVRRGELVLDVGAGTGALTRCLLDAGARVIAVELHPARVATLRERFAGEAVTVVRADATDLYLPRRPFRVVANPPFGATAALLRRLLGHGSRMTAADLVLALGTARRYASGRYPGAARVERAFTLRSGRHVPRHAFVPRPPSGAAMLVVRRR